MATINVGENYSWEIKFDDEGKPYYHNWFSDRVLLSRPNCFESGGRVNIKQPVIEAQFKGLWYKGVLLGPADQCRFSVQLEHGPVQQLYADRNRIRKWSKLQRHSTKSSVDSTTCDRESKDTFSESDDDLSLSKLSDTFTGNNSSDEKYDIETLQEDEKDFKQPVNLGNKRMVVQSRIRSKSVGSARKKEPDTKDWSDEELDSDWMESMLPLRANPQGEGVGRKQRVNAVILDLQDLRSINNSLS